MVLYHVVIVATISTSMHNLVLVSKSAQTLHMWELSKPLDYVEYWMDSRLAARPVLKPMRYIA